MHSLHVLAVVCGVSLSVAGGAAIVRAQAPPATAADQAAVRDVVARYVAARERRDAAAIGGLFTSDADQLTSSGEWRRGRDGVVEGTLRSSEANSGQRSIQVETVKFPTPTVAIADGRYEIAGAGTAPGAARQLWSTFVMVRTTDGWRISAIRNMAPTGRSR